MNCNECAKGYTLKGDEGKEECVKEEEEEPAHDEL